MALSDHMRMAVVVDGVFQVTVQDVQVNGTSGNQVVETLQGLAGKTPGSKMLTITGKWSVPITGLETDLMTAVANGTYHELQIPVGSQTIVSSGWFDEFTLGGSTGQSTEFSATF
jgi:hypothetical protein